MAYFPKYRSLFELAENPEISRNLNKTVDVKIGGNFSEVFKHFTFGQVVLHYIHQETL